MAAKTYTVRYYKDDKPIVRQVKNFPELNVLLSGDAANCFVESKPSENMPLKMHNRIAAHNASILTDPPKIIQP